MTSHTKTWKLQTQDERAIAALCAALDILPITARLLYNRGYCDPDSAGAFLRKESGVFHDPFLLTDMERAAVRIRNAIEHGERITVYGDYDADGVTATTILYLYLSSQGADVRYYIPGRFDEGYGLNSDAVERLAADGTTLIVTVDTGVTAIAEVALARLRGMDVIVTDHHACRPELPDCTAVINPHREGDRYPFKELAGVGVAFKLICALECFGITDLVAKREAMRRLCAEYAEFAAIGTIADVMPLRDENRLLVNVGLALLKRTDKPGILALMDAAQQNSGAGAQEPSRYPKKRKITASYISFTIAPRINAIGRIYTAARAVELFLTDSPEYAARLANELCDANRERQETENRIAAEAYAQVENEHDLSREHILVLAGEGWHHGVIGIVASRVTEKYHLPCILFSYETEDGVPRPTDEGKGSGRSIDGFCMIEALCECEELLVRFGGHAMAAGLTVTREKLPAFRARIEACAARAFSEGVPDPILPIDCDTAFSDVCLRTVEEIYLLEPFGCANPQPQLCLRGARIEDVSALSQGKHTRILLANPEDDAQTRTAMAFGVRTELFPFAKGDVVDVVYSMDVNEFRGERTVQMLLSDIVPHTPGETAEARQQRTYARLLAGIAAIPEECGSADTVLPTREDCRAVWLLLREAAAEKEGTAVTYRALSYHSGIGQCRVRIICDMFVDTGLIVRTRNTDEGFVFRVALPSGQKIDLTAAPQIRHLRRVFGLL